MLCTEYETDEASLTVRKDRTFSENPFFSKTPRQGKQKSHGVKKNELFPLVKHLGTERA